MVRKILIVLVVIFVLPAAVYAESPSVPHFLNYQSLLYDDGGNLLPDGPTDVTLKITDASGTVLYEERQTVDVVHGAVSALVGNGLDSSGAPLGGIPSSVLSPDSGRYLEVTVDGYPPESSMEIVSVPYAVYAEKALGAADESITGDALAKKSITMEHFADGLMSDLATQMGTAGLIATRTDLTNLQTTYRGTTGASTIGVTGGFVYSGSNNLQGVLQDLDRAIQHRQAGIETVQTSITNETSARISSDNTLQTNINNEASARAGVDTSHASTNISTAHPNGTFPISRLSTDIATQSELNAEASARAGADSAEATARSDADTAEAGARAAADAAEASARGGFDSTHTHTGGADGSTLYGNAFEVASGNATSGNLIAPPTGFSIGNCHILLALRDHTITDGIDSVCIKSCVTSTPEGDKFVARCQASSAWHANSCAYFFTGEDFCDLSSNPGEACRVNYMIFCYK